MAPASTTVWASSGECLQISLRAEAAMRFRDNSGSCYMKSIVVTGELHQYIELPCSSQPIYMVVQ